jgi:hypothetical protein
VAARRYAFREKRGADIPQLKVGLLGKVGKNVRIKIRFEDGPHPGREGYASTRQSFARGGTGVPSFRANGAWFGLPSTPSA